MRKLLLMVVLLASMTPVSHAQNVGIPANSAPPDCIIGPVTVFVTGASVSLDNRFSGCTTWTLYEYGNTATASVSVQLEEAPDNTPAGTALGIAGTPGSFVIWPAADLGQQSLMPLTAITSDQSSAFEFFPWVRVNVTTLTGAGGDVTYMAFGYRPRFGADASANGVASTLTNSSDPCQSPAISKSSFALNIVAAGTTQPVAPSGATSVYVCGGSFTIGASGTTADTIQFITGTGATCGASTVTNTGTYGSGTATATNPDIAVTLIASSGTVFKSAAGSGLCIVAAGTTVSIQGVVSYVQQ